MLARVFIKATKQVLARSNLKRNLGQRVTCASFGTNSTTSNDANRLTMDFPRERDGLDYKLNWSLAANSVVPQDDAYRNASVEKLQKFYKDAKLGTDDCQMQSVGVDVTYDDYDVAFEEVTNHLSHVPNLFVQDGAIGSFANERTSVRIISDNAVVAHAALNLLVRIPLKQALQERPIVVYVATTGEFENKKANALVLVDADDSDAKFSRILITGMPSASTLIQCMFSAKQKLMKQCESTSLLLPCDVMIKEDKSAMIFNANDSGRASGVLENVLYAAHGSVWNNDGVTSLFGGAIVSSNDKYESADEALSMKDSMLVRVASNNIVNHPKVAIIVDREAKGSKSISTKEFLGKIKELDNESKTTLEKMLSTHKTSTYIVSKEAQATKLLEKA